MGPIDRRSDDELVAICNVGDALDAARAVEALYRRHRDFVLRVARGCTHDRELAFDTLQETFAYLLKRKRLAQLPENRKPRARFTPR